MCILDGGSGQLVLGARVIGSGEPAARFQLQPDGTSDGHPLWADSRNTALRVGWVDGCVRTGPFRLRNARSPDLGIAAQSSPHRAGNQSGCFWNANLGGRQSGEPPFWSFLTKGSEKSADLVRVISDKGPFFNSGVQAFYDFTITYNTKKGRVTLTR